jgi:hypothetical protein
MLGRRRRQLQVREGCLGGTELQLERWAVVCSCSVLVRRSADTATVVDIRSEPGPEVAVVVQVLAPVVAPTAAAAAALEVVVFVFLAGS